MRDNAHKNLAYNTAHGKLRYYMNIVRGVSSTRGLLDCVAVGRAGPGPPTIRSYYRARPRKTTGLEPSPDAGYAAHSRTGRNVCIEIRGFPRRAETLVLILGVVF